MFQKHTYLKKFGRKIKILRERAGLDQATLGELAGTSRVTVFNIENAKVATNLDVAFGLAKALNVSLFELFADDDTPPVHTIEECYRRIGDRLKQQSETEAVSIEQLTPAEKRQEMRMRVLEALKVVKEWYNSASHEQQDTFLSGLKKKANHDK